MILIRLVTYVNLRNSRDTQGVADGQGGAV